MDEKQMLLMAAKAAGFDNVEWGEAYPIGDATVDCTDMLFVDDAPWDPLNDDGDALRLAVKLRLVLGIERDRSCTSVGDHSGRFGVQPWGAEGPEAATRLAIVRAAAAIGEQSNG